MESKRQKHEEKMKLLQKHFKKLKLIAILICIGVNVIADVLAFIFASVEIILFIVLVVLWISCMFLFTYLRNLNKIKVTQETLLMEETPLGKMKF